MTARQIIEAEDPKSALRGNFGRKITITLDDVDTRWVKSGNPDYPDHWTAMWNNPFTIRHRSKIKGCPLGSSFEAGQRGRIGAIRDLVRRTNQESGTEIIFNFSDSDRSFYPELGGG